MTTKKATTATKRAPRADKGKKHTPGAGRPVGTGKAAKIDPALAGRMAKLDKFLTGNEAFIKASGVASQAKVTGPVLAHLRKGTALTEGKVASVEAAIIRFLEEGAGAFGYTLTKK